MLFSSLLYTFDKRYPFVKMDPWVADELRRGISHLFLDRTKKKSPSIEYLFSLYDEYFFDDTLATLVWKSKGLRIRAGFDDAVGERGVVLITISRNSADPFFEMEGMLVHLTLFLLDQEDYDEDSGSFVSVWESADKVRQCMHAALFGRSFVPKSGYVNWSNSCYVDALMMIIFDARSPYWRRAFFLTDTSTVRYEKNPQGICSQGSLVDTEAQVREFAQLIQKQAKYDYEFMHDDSHRSPIRCTLFRLLLSRCLPNVREKGHWVAYDAGMVYSLFTDLFPPMALRFRLEGDDAGSPPARSTAFFTMWDFLEGATGRGSVDWDSYDHPVAVFYNGGTPAIRTFDASGDQMMENGDTVTKKHRFSPTLLFPRVSLDLVGVVVLIGQIGRTSSSYGHYICYFKGTSGKWHVYDDMGVGSVNPISSLPRKGVWETSGGHMPAMYFYATSAL